MKKTLQGRTAVLTGATGGIGSAVAQELARAGVRLVLVGRNEARLEALLGELAGSGHVAVSADLATKRGLTKLADLANSGFVDVDILVNCLGTSDFRLVENQDDDSIESLLRTNLMGPMFVCRDLLPALRRQKNALIVNVGSTFGSIGYPGFTTYCASKFGLRGFTEALRRELADSNVSVSYFAPRATRTALNAGAVDAMNAALGTAVDDPAAVATAILKTINGRRQARRFLGWPEKLFVRINALLPGLVDRALRRQLPTIRRFAQTTIK